MVIDVPELEKKSLVGQKEVPSKDTQSTKEKMPSIKVTVSNDSNAYEENGMILDMPEKEKKSLVGKTEGQPKAIQSAQETLQKLRPPEDQKARTETLEKRYNDNPPLDSTTLTKFFDRRLQPTDGKPDKMLLDQCNRGILLNEATYNLPINLPHPTREDVQRAKDVFEKTQPKSQPNAATQPQPTSLNNNINVAQVVFSKNSNEDEMLIDEQVQNKKSYIDPEDAMEDDLYS